jgi:multidrug efflux pump subunit AcrB
MVKFLINRPVAVIMSFLAVVLLGLVAGGLLPVSLLPDIRIPEITIQVSHPNSSARELENMVVRPLRQQLLQVGRLTDIESEARDGNAIIRLRFAHGANMDYLYIEVNEKIDAAMGQLPRSMERPRVIKASASDIPVFYLNLFMKNPGGGNHELSGFMELSEFADWVIRKRIEQLPQVAMVDVSGLVYQEVSVIPDPDKIAGLGLTHDHFREALELNNLTLLSLMVKDGIYQYNVRFTSTLSTVDDIENIFLMAGDRLFRFKDLASVSVRPRKPQGLYSWGGKPALSLAIIKQSEARMNDMKDEMHRLMGEFKADYPLISFELSQDQTGILDYTIGNLRNNLILGGGLAILLMFLFLKDMRSPLLIAISVPASIVISLLFFWLTGLSLNIISLSGLILGVGMMIDNSIIVIDNITQHIERGHPLHEACVMGTNEVIRPLISSVLTTCAVFVPLIFLSGISGALFYDQAVAVASGLLASLVVSVTLIPTLFHLIHINTSGKKGQKVLRSFQIFHLENAYNRGFDFVFKYRGFAFLVVFLLLALAGYLTMILPLQKVPPLEQVEIVLKVDWNENIHLDENMLRVSRLTGQHADLIAEAGIYGGRQQFLLSREMDMEINHAHVYLKSDNPASLYLLKEKLNDLVREEYPLARIGFEPPVNVFDQIFESHQPPLVAKFTMVRGQRVPEVEQMRQMGRMISERFPDTEFIPLPLDENLVMRIEPEKLLLYRVNQNFLHRQLQTALDQYEIGQLRSDQNLVPIVLGNEERDIENIVSTMLVRNSLGTNIPVSALVNMTTETGYKTITAGRQGEFLPVVFDQPGQGFGRVVSGIEEIVRQDASLDVAFAGSWFDTRMLMREMMLVVLISILLLYFILAAQFESLLQPLIVMLEIPVNMAGVFLALFIAGAGINIMSMIGIVVMAGIVINDSILKIDTINHLRATGMPLMDAIHTGGTRRLKPIVMTSLTTILALVPILITTDIGSELQAPLALAIIGGMTLGTLVSLYLIPLMYWYLYRNSR